MTIIGHRGARHEAPENTLLGFEHLRNLGINHVELDVRLSQDNILMVIHDATVDRTTQGKGKVSHLTALKLQGLNAAHGFVPENSDTVAFSGIPTLDNVLRTWPDLEHIQLEIKPTDRRRHSTIARELDRQIRANDLDDMAVVTSSDTQFLNTFKRRYPYYSTGLVADRWCRNPVGLCTQLRCDLLALNQDRCRPKTVAKAHALGIDVSVWTVNNPAKALALLNMGVDSIITDAPSLMLRHLG